MKKRKPQFHYIRLGRWNTNDPMVQDVLFAQLDEYESAWMQWKLKVETIVAAIWNQDMTAIMFPII